MPRPEKVEAVKEIARRFEESEAALLTEYRGLRVPEIAEVRGALRAADAEYKVLKNTLTRLAVREVGLEDLVEWLEGPTAVVFVKGDVVEAAKALDEASGKYPVLVVKGGALRGGKLIDAGQAKALAKLESREVLLTKIAMMMNQPATRAANVLVALLRDLGSMLGQVQQKKESGELPGGPGEEPVAQATGADEATESVEEAPETDKTEAEKEEGKPEGDTATPEASGETPQAEDAGVPSPEGQTPQEKAASPEDAPVPEATAEEDDEDDTDSSDDSTSEDSESEEEEEEK